MHFGVLVITPRKPSREDLVRILAPWHEFECTGNDDQYVLDLDVTENLKTEYQEKKVTRLRGPDGTLHDPHDNRFYRDPTSAELEKIGPLAGGGGDMDGSSYLSKDWGDGRGYRPKVRWLPPGYAEVELAWEEVESFVGFVHHWTHNEFVAFGQKPELEDRHKFGYVLLTESGAVDKVIVRTNQNAKWDSWQLGGRWSGFFDPNYNPEEDPANQEICSICGGSGKRAEMNGANRCDRCNGTGVTAKWPTEWRTPTGNQVRVGDLPLEELRLEAESQAAADYDKFHQVLAGRTLPDRDALVEKLGFERARTIYMSDPAVKDLRVAGFHVFADNEMRAYLQPRLEYLRQARESTLLTRAIVKDGKWYDRHDSGPEVWRRQFAALLNGLSREDWLTIVDCHT